MALMRKWNRNDHGGTCCTLLYSTHRHRPAMLRAEQTSCGRAKWNTLLKKRAQWRASFDDVDTINAGLLESLHRVWWGALFLLSCQCDIDEFTTPADNHVNKYANFSDKQKKKNGFYFFGTKWNKKNSSVISNSSSLFYLVQNYVKLSGVMTNRESLPPQAAR